MKNKYIILINSVLTWFTSVITFVNTYPYLSVNKSVHGLFDL